MRSTTRRFIQDHALQHAPNTISTGESVKAVSEEDRIASYSAFVICILVMKEKFRKAMDKPADQHQLSTAIERKKPKNTHDHSLERLPTSAFPACIAVDRRSAAVRDSKTDLRL